MNKKSIMIVAGVLAVLLIIGGGVWFLRSRRTSSLISPAGELGPEAEVKLATWEDQAGFSFSYPENIEIDPHEEDTENYAHLELTSDHPGEIIIWCQDTTYADIEDWAEEELEEEGQVFDTELGGEPAKKVAYLEPKKMVTATIDVDALVLIEMLPDEEGYWQGVHDQILSSFVFIPLEGEEAVAPGPWEGEGGAGGIIVEPEEVIE